MKLPNNVNDIDFWRALNPELTISRTPFLPEVHPYDIPLDIAPKAVKSLQESGFFLTPAIIPQKQMEKLAKGIAKVAQAGYPSVFACVYDEFYQIYGGLKPLIISLLGKNYVTLAEGFWAYFIGVGQDGSTPHRDSLGPDKYFHEKGIPSLINLWIPLTDTTLDNSCMYVLPYENDPNIQMEKPHGQRIDVNLMNVRPLPAAAGSVLGWSSHLLHWSSNSNKRRAHAPRISLALYFQRYDVPPFDESVVEMNEDIPFEKRLHWIARTISNPELFKYPKPS